MIPVFSFAFREYLEVFLIIGVILGITKKLYPHLSRKVLVASGTGVILSLILPVIFFIGGSEITQHLSEDLQAWYEAVLMIISSICIAYVLFSLHKLFQKGRQKIMLDVHKTLEQGVFDRALFLLIVFLIGREGLEIGLFTASTSALSTFSQNMLTLLFGFVASACIGLISTMATRKIPLTNMFIVLEWILLIQGAALLQKGISKILELAWGFKTASIGTFMLPLPSDQNILGELTKAFTGLTAQYSLAQLAITLIYIGTMIMFFKKSYART